MYVCTFGISLTYILDPFCSRVNTTTDSNDTNIRNLKIFRAARVCVEDKEMCRSRLTRIKMIDRAVLTIRPLNIIVTNIYYWPYPGFTKVSIYVKIVRILG